MDLEFKLKSLYVCVKDMKRAIEFYESLLGQKVTEKITYIVFLILMVSGMDYLLMRRWMKQKWGNNCLPSLEVNDIDLALKN